MPTQVTILSQKLRHAAVKAAITVTRSVGKIVARYTVELPPETGDENFSHFFWAHDVPEGLCRGY
jgi:hypothetical protein